MKFEFAAHGDILKDVYEDANESMHVPVMNSLVLWGLEVQILAESAQCFLVLSKLRVSTMPDLLIPNSPSWARTAYGRGWKIYRIVASYEVRHSIASPAHWAARQFLGSSRFLHCKLLPHPVSSVRHRCGAIILLTSRGHHHPLCRQWKAGDLLEPLLIQ